MLDTKIYGRQANRGSMRRRQGPDAVLIAVLSSCGLLALLGCLVLMDNAQKSATKPSQPTAAQSKVTLANFQKVRDGMTKAQVVRILGANYTPQFSVKAEQVATEVLQWEQGDNRVAVVGFADGKVITRSQVRLK